MSDILISNIISPAVLVFMLGLAASLLKSDLAVPKGLSDSLSIYLLLAIGLKGGIELSKYPVTELVKPLLGGVLLGCFIPLVTILFLLKRNIDEYHAVAIAATYGSVSIVTYGAGADFLQGTGVPYEGFMSAVVAVMEVPAIMISLMVLNAFKSGTSTGKQASSATFHSRWIPVSMKHVDLRIVRETLISKSILLLLGGLLIGWACGVEARSVIQPLFIDLYRGVLILFLLTMGIVCGAQLREAGTKNSALIGFALLAPLVYGLLGVLCGKWTGLSLGGAALMGVLSGSASYIAAPAALRSAVPQANPSTYLGLALGITFPLNLSIGIPFNYFAAKLIYSIF
ncbi:sodium-dependent bicarbonate transport family permease [Paenibacillus alkalitolerans]|uniref:sodium-dependent bicarbonate transport family permease n=1 Tax=Paenibacillus alkalitolerans TaxID=2799335 RepID=UPI0018F4909A|nr:sodium-dependent bicarbonate transport family permease [Paenibacillus alkalitolerans]